MEDRGPAFPHILEVAGTATLDTPGFRPNRPCGRGPEPDADAHGRRRDAMSDFETKVLQALDRLRERLGAVESQLKTLNNRRNRTAKSRSAEERRPDIKPKPRSRHLTTGD